MQYIHLMNIAKMGRIQITGDSGMISQQKIKRVMVEIVNRLKSEMESPQCSP